MKIRLKARRIAGNDPVTFRNPKGEAIQLNEIGSVSQELDPEVAYKLCNQFPDVIEVVTGEAPAAKMAKAPENKVMPAPMQAKVVKRGSDEDNPLPPPAA